MAIVRFTGGNDFITLGSDATFLGLGGDDIYVLDPFGIPANADITVADTQGANTIRLPDGLEIVSSDVATLGNGSNGVQLTLSNGSTIFIDGAGGFTFQVGGNNGGIGSITQTFEEFVEDTLGTTVPAPGETSMGGPVTIGQPEVTVAAGAPVLEGDPPEMNALSFTVSLDRPAGQDVTLDFTASGGTADGSDFTVGTQTVTVLAGETSAEVLVPITADLFVELDETVVGTISNPSNARLGDTTSATATILDDDLPIINIIGQSVIEGEAGDGRNLVFTVRLTDPSDPDPITGTPFAALEDVSFTVSTTQNGTATSGTDFTPVITGATILAGLSETQIVVPIIGDSDAELDETVEAIIVNPIGAEPGVTTATGTIVNDDQALLSISDAADVVEGDAGGSNVLSYEVTLDQPSPVDITFDVNTIPGGTASSDIDFVALNDTVTIAAGDTSATVEVAIIGDDVVEPDETVLVQISNAQAVDGSNVVAIDEDTASGTIIDDDRPTISIAPATVVEGNPGDDRQLAFEITIDPPVNEEVSFTFTVTGGTATAGADFTAFTQRITVAPNVGTAIVNVNVAEDLLVEADETVTATILNASSNADIVDGGAVVSMASATGTIVNDDAPAVSIRDGSVIEGDDGTVELEFSVELAAAFDEDVTVDYATTDLASASAGTDFVAETGSITIPAGSTSATASITVNGDIVEEGDEVFGVSISNARVDGSPQIIVPIARADGVMTITDDDGAFILTTAVDVFTTDQNSSGGVFADDGQDIFIANDTTLNPGDKLDGGGNPADMPDTVLYSTNATSIVEAGFRIDNVENFVATVNASDGKNTSFEMSSVFGLETVTSANSSTSVSWTDLRNVVDVVLDNLTNVTGNTVVTVSYDGSDAAPELAGQNTMEVTHDATDLQELVVTSDAPALPSTLIETINYTTTGNTPSLGSLSSRDVQTVNFVVGLEDFNIGDPTTETINPDGLGDVNPANDAIASNALTTITIDSSDEASAAVDNGDGDFRLNEDVSNATGTLTVTAAASFLGSMVLQTLTVTGRTLTVNGDNARDVNDFVVIDGTLSTGANDTFNLGGGTDDSVIMDETTANSGRISAPIGGGTEYVDVVEEGGNEVGGAIDAFEIGGIEELRLFDVSYTANLAETLVDTAVESLPLAGIQNTGLTINNAPAGLVLTSALLGASGDLTVNGSSPFTARFVVNGTGVMNNLSVNEVDVLTLDLEGNGSATFNTITDVDFPGLADLNEIIIGDDGPEPNEDPADPDQAVQDDFVSLLIGNTDDTLNENVSTAQLSIFDGTASNAPQFIEDLAFQDSGTNMKMTGSNGDRVSVTDDNVDDFAGTSPNYDAGLIATDMIDTGAGNDLIRATDFGDIEGSDTIIGGTGRDTLESILDTFAASDADFTNMSELEVFLGSDDAVGAGDNIAAGAEFEEAGFDSVFLRMGDDTFNAAGVSSATGLFINAGMGNDNVFGGAGNDVIRPGTGDFVDNLVGNAGDDDFVVSGSNQLKADDTIDGGNGGTDGSANDRIVLDGNSGFPEGNPSNIQPPAVGGDGESDDVAVVLGAGVQNIETIVALNNGSDSLTDEEDGLPGDFYVEFDGYNDGAITVDGSALGSDKSLYVEAGAANATGGVLPTETITVLGGNDDDTMNGSAANDVFTGDDGNDEVLGNGGNDTLNGGNDDDILVGGAGDDVIVGGEGDDILVGGIGADQINAGVNPGDSGADIVVAPSAAESKGRFDAFGNFLGDTISNFDFTLDRIALNDDSVTDVQTGFVTIPFAEANDGPNGLAQILKQNNEIQSRYVVTPESDALLVTVLNGSAAGTYLIAEDGTDTTSYDPDEDPTFRLIDPLNTDNFEANDFVENSLVVTINVVDNGIPVVGNVLDNLIILPDTFLNSPIDGLLGTDTLQGTGDPTTDISGVVTKNLEVLDGQGGGFIMTEKQYEDFDTFQKVPNVTIDMIDGDGNIVGNDEIPAVVFTAGPVTYTLASTGGVSTQDVTFSNAGDTIEDGGATSIIDSKIDAAGGDDTFNLDNVTLINPTILNGGAGADTFNVAALATIAAGSKILGGSEGDTVNGGAAISISGTIDLEGGADTATLGAVTLNGGGELLGGSETDTLTLNGTSDLSAGKFEGWENVNLGTDFDLTLTGAQHAGIGTLTGAGDNTVTISDDTATVAAFPTIETYNYAQATDIAFTITADAQVYNGSDAAKDTVEVNNPGNFTGTISTGAGDDTVNGTGPITTGTVTTGGGDDTVNAVAGLSGGTISTGSENDTVNVSGNLLGGQVDLGNGNDELSIAAGVTDLGTTVFDGGFGADNVKIDLGAGGTMNISGASFKQFSTLELDGTGTVILTTAQAAQFLNVTTVNAGPITYAINDGSSATIFADDVISTYILSDDGNVITVDGPNPDNTGQTVVGGEKADTVNFTAEGTITPGELDLSGGGKAGDGFVDTLNIGRTSGFDFETGAGDVPGFEVHNIELTGQTLGAGFDNGEDYKGVFGALDLVNPTTFDFAAIAGSTQTVDDNFFLDTSASGVDVTIQGLLIADDAGADGGDSYTVTTGGADDSLSVGLAENVDFTNTLAVSIDLGADIDGDSLTIALSGKDAIVDTTGGDTLDNIEFLTVSGTTATPADDTKATFTFDSGDAFETLDFSGVTADMRLVLNDLDTLADNSAPNNTVAVMGGSGAEALMDVGGATASGTGDFSVDLNAFFNNDLLIDNNGVATNTVTVLDFGNAGGDQIGLNVDGGLGSGTGLDTVTNVTTPAGSNDALAGANGDTTTTIGNLAILTDLAAAELTNPTDVADGGDVELKIVEAQLDNDTAAAQVDGELYVALDDGTDTFVYRATISTGLDFNVDSTADITDLQLVAIIDGVNDVDPGDFF